ncbi:MAG: hypothetical protein WC100_02590 [Sterolibacterium sp.]
MINLDTLQKAAEEETARDSDLQLTPDTILKLIEVARAAKTLCAQTNLVDFGCDLDVLNTALEGVE